MKKTIIVTICVLLLTYGIVSAAQLWEYGSFAERAEMAVDAGIVAEVSQYEGSLEQNIALLNFLQGNLGATIQAPSRFKQTLVRNLNNTMATSSTIYVSGLTTLDGQTLSTEELGDCTVYTINPGAGSEEKILCTGVDTSATTLTGCRRGLKYTNVNSETDNVKSHSAGETIIISNDQQCLALQYAQLDEINTFNDDITLSTTTSPVVKLYFGDNAGGYLWYNTTTDAMGYATSTDTERSFTEGGTTFATVPPINLISGELKLNTSTYDFILRDTLFAVATSSISSGTASGNVFDDQWNTRWNNTTTKNLDFTFSDDLTVTGDVTISSDATTTGSLHYSELIDSNNTSVTVIPNVVTSSAGIISFTGGTARQSLVTYNVIAGFVDNGDILEINFGGSKTGANGSASGGQIQINNEDVFADDGCDLGTASGGKYTSKLTMVFGDGNNATWFGECIGVGDDTVAGALQPMTKTTTTLDFDNTGFDIEFQGRLDNSSDTFTVDGYSIIKF